MHNILNILFGLQDFWVLELIQAFEIIATGYKLYWLQSLRKALFKARLTILTAAQLSIRCHSDIKNAEIFVLFCENETLNIFFFLIM